MFTDYSLNTNYYTCYTLLYLLHVSDVGNCGSYFCKCWEVSSSDMWTDLYFERKLYCSFENLGYFESFWILKLCLNYEVQLSFFKFQFKSLDI